MLIREYEDFLLRQCAVCSLSLEISTRVDTVMLSKTENPFAANTRKIDFQDEIQSMEAISYVFGVSKDYLTSKLIRYSQDVLTTENNTPVKRVAEFADVTKIVFCKKCASLVARIYLVQKVFMSVTNTSSLIFHTLGQRFSLQRDSLETSLTDGNSEIKPEQDDEIDPSLENEVSTGIPDVDFEFNEVSNQIKDEHFSDSKIPEVDADYSTMNPITMQNLQSGKNYSKNSVNKVRNCNPDFFPSKHLVVSLERLEDSVENKALLKKAERFRRKVACLSTETSRILKKKKIRKIIAKKGKLEKFTGDATDSDGDFNFSNTQENCESSEDYCKPVPTTKTASWKPKRNNISKIRRNYKKDIKSKRAYISCVYCEKPFKLASEREEHVKSFHPHNSNSVPENEVPDPTENPISFEFSIQPYFCRCCKVGYQNRSGILCHNRICHDNLKRYDCKYCEESFGSTAALVVHLSEIHKEIVKPERDEDIHTCRECGNEFYARDSVRRHIKNTGHTKYICKCSFCEKTFTDRRKLQRHKNTEHSDKLVGNKSVVAPASASRKLNVEKLALMHKLNNYQCPFCDKQFPSKEESDEHKLTHGQDTLYRCPKCPKTFTKECYFNRHLLLVHSRETTTHQCNRCDRTFSKYVYYRKHLNEHIHLEKGQMERPVCHICGSTFKAIKFLQKHINVIHQGKGAQQCDRCGYVARTNWDMKCHVKVHQRNGKPRRQISKKQLQPQS